jgi:hypothetical protein
MDDDEFVSLPNGDYVREHFVAGVRKEQGSGDWLVIVEIGGPAFLAFEQSISHHADEAAANAAMSDLKAQLV